MPIETDTSVLSPIEKLRHKFPFPATDGIEEFYFSVDGGGREILVDLIQRESIDLMIEIGCFLCGSSIQWLEANPNLTLIGIDPWSTDFATILDRWNGNPNFETCFATVPNVESFIASVREHGSYLSAVANVKPFQDRFIPVQAPSPQILPTLQETGIAPQLIYFDSTKELDDLQISHDLFPDAILAGDDWTWGKDQGFPVRQVVNEFCQSHGFTVEAQKATWIIKR